MVVWGGDSAVTNALRYAGPGFEIVSFDPKVSISMVGREIHTPTTRLLDDAAERAATDVSLFNQDACAASRYVYAEGDIDESTGFARGCWISSPGTPAVLGGGRAVVQRLRDEVEVLKTLEPIYRVWGDYSGAGLIVRSEDPVDFYPVSKTVNVVAVVVARGRGPLRQRRDPDRRNLSTAACR